MAELTIGWETLDKLPTIEKKAAPVVTSETATSPSPDDPIAAATTSLTTDKPYLVYVTDGQSASGYDTVEKVILDDDRVKLGSKAFHMVRMSPDAAKADGIVSKNGKEVPRFVLVSADQKWVKALEANSLKLGEVWGAMKATADKLYKNDLDGMVRELRSVLNEFDKVYKERQVQDDKEKRLGDKATPADKKDIAAKRAELDAREKKAQGLRDKLMELKPKDLKDPKTEAKTESKDGKTDGKPA